MSVVVKKQLVTSRSKTYGGTNGRKFIAIHETANTSKGADAQRHANLQTNGFSASWHYSVDDKHAVQSFPHTAQCFHAGDGRGDGNLNSIGIEICVNSDGDFGKAVDNAAKLVRKIMAEEGIPLANIKQHNFFSGKNCPTNLRNGSKGINWVEFIALVEGKTASIPGPVKVVETAKAPAKKAPSVYTGGSVVDYLRSIKVDSSAGNRRKLASEYGVKGYDLSASKNAELLAKMRGGIVPAKAPVKKAPSSGLPTGVIRQGARGANVTAIQKALASAYFYPDKAAKNNGVDGVYGAKTTNAVRRFQSMNGLTADGVYGPATRAKLIK